MRILILITDPKMSGLWLDYFNHFPTVPDRLYIGQIHAYETPAYRAVKLYRSKVGEDWPEPHPPLPLLHPDLTKLVTGIQGETHVFLAVREGTTMPRPSWKFRDLFALRKIMVEADKSLTPNVRNNYAFKAGVRVLIALREVGGLQ